MITICSFKKSLMEDGFLRKREKLALQLERAANKEGPRHQLREWDVYIIKEMEKLAVKQQELLLQV